jgi:hypothetical protein
MSKPISGLPSRLRGYAKELVAEVVGDARLQEDGKADILRGHQLGDEPQAFAPEDAPMNDRTAGDLMRPRR